MPNNPKKHGRYLLFSGSIKDLDLKEKMVISTMNQYSYCVAEKDEAFRAAIQESDIILPDGIGMVAMTKLISGQTIQKIAGNEIHYHFLKLLNHNGGSCFYLGSSEKTLVQIKSKLEREFPKIRPGFYSPPFKASFTKKENTEILKAINNFRPDVLFIGMTAPKQEKWANEFKSRIEAQIICSIGAVFDFYAGTKKRPGKFWIDLGLEWLARLISEPKRMWKRYLYYGPIFVYYMFKERLRTLPSVISD